MPSPAALALTLTFIAAALWRLRASSASGCSGALWLPVAWIFFAASKFPSQWLQMLGIYGAGGVSMEEGSPLDAFFFLLLIVTGIFVLARRKVTLGELVRNNVWLSVFVVYCFLSVFWSDFPLVAFKRWVKVFGHPVMALLILTDPQPIAALKLVLKRAAVMMVPLSVLFIKYYPEFGRYFDPWTGEAGNGGIHHNKNELGYACMIFGVFCSWCLISSRRIPSFRERVEEAVSVLLLLGMIGWLVAMADSMTSLACLVIGVVTLVLCGTRLVSRRFLTAQIVVLVALAAAIELTFGVYARTVAMLGRDSTLTDRTAVWADLFAININPIIGVGFESFWLGWRRELLWQKWWWKPIQAHNGYIETYVNLGWIGVGLLFAVIAATFRKCRAELLRNVDYGRMRLAFLFVVLAYNYTEAAFKGVHLVWTIFHFVAMDYPRSTSVARVVAPPLPAENNKSVRRRFRQTRPLQPAARVGRDVAALSVRRPTSQATGPTRLPRNS